MARGLRRGPKLLRFQSLLASVADCVARIVDTRQLNKIRFSLRDCYLSGLALFFVQDSSLLQFQRRFQRTAQANNLAATFGVRNIPVDSQFRDLLDRHGFQPLLSAFANWIGRLQRCKWLQHFQIFDARYLITLDGSGYFNSELVHCEHCLTTTTSGVTRYHHDILAATIVHPDKRQVLPLAPEFIRNSDGKGGKYHKQDCEINAGYRMLDRLRADYPRMAAIIVADSLYSKQPFVERLRAARFSFLLVAKPGDHKSLYQDIAGLRRGNLLHRLHTEHRGERHEYEWVTGVPLNGQSDAPLINFIQVRISKPGTKPYRNAWVTDLVPTRANIAQLVRAARAGRSRTKPSTRSRTRATTWSTISATATSICRRRCSCSTCWRFSCTRCSNWSMACINACAPCSVPAVRSGTRCAPPSGCFCFARGTRCWCA